MVLFATYAPSPHAARCVSVTSRLFRTVVWAVFLHLTKLFWTPGLSELQICALRPLRPMPADLRESLLCLLSMDTLARPPRGHAGWLVVTVHCVTGRVRSYLRSSAS